MSEDDTGLGEALAVARDRGLQPVGDITPTQALMGQALVVITPDRACLPFLSLVRVVGVGSATIRVARGDRTIDGSWFPWRFAYPEVDWRLVE